MITFKPQQKQKLFQKLFAKAISFNLYFIW